MEIWGIFDRNLVIPPSQEIWLNITNRRGIYYLYISYTQVSEIPELRRPCYPSFFGEIIIHHRLPMVVYATQEEIKTTKLLFLLKISYKYIVYLVSNPGSATYYRYFLNKSPNLSKSQFLIPQNEDISLGYFTGLL